MSTTAKDTIYIDIDDEITSIVEKMQASKSGIVALVLPKRAQMLQSTVNMRLLKRAAKEAHKNIVLITSDHNLLPLAGAAGLHVAKSLSSKPSIPPIPKVDDQTETVQEEEAPIDATKSVGELAGLPNEPEKEETIEVDNDPAAGTAAAAATKPAERGKKKLKIPNFEKFRLKFFLVTGGIILLLVGWIWAFVIAPRAKVFIKTDTTTATVLADFIAKTDTTTADLANGVLPAETKSLKKSETQKVPATGEKNTGNKAKGTMTIYNCTDNPVTVAAGTKFTNSGLSYATDEAVTVPNSNFTSSGSCKKDKSANAGVTAVEGGDKYNLSGGRTYSSSISSTLTGTGSAMSGGTNQIVKVVSDADIEAAKQKSATNSTVTEELRALLAQNQLIALSDTLSNEAPVITSTPKVGEEATEVTVTIEVNYQMTGVKENDLKQLIETAAGGQNDLSRQAVVDHGLDDIVFRVVEKASATESKVNLQTLARLGPKLNDEEIKKDIIGKKRGDAEALIASRPGVKEVRIEYSPFWVLSTPKSAKKITVIVEQVQQSTNESQQ